MSSVVFIREVDSKNQLASKKSRHNLWILTTFDAGKRHLVYLRVKSDVASVMT